MRRICSGVLAVAVLLGVGYPTSAGAAPESRPEQPYIVVLRDNQGDPGQVASEHARRDGARVSHVY